MEKYSQGRVASEEILRIVIQRMAAHPAAFTPHTYAVWYEFIKGVNPGLITDMDKLLASGLQLDDVTIEHLFESHVSEFKQDINRILREDMRQMLTQLINITTETGKQTRAFGNNLHDYGKQLSAKPGSPVLDDLIARMASDAKSMQGSMHNLHVELEHSKEEVGKLQKALESARKEALIDPLTSIYNRRGFELQVQRMFANSDLMSKGASMLMVDIDNFKTVNDTYGHLFGDKVIRTLANTLKSLVKGQDCVARMGGEEFAVMLPGTPLAGACTVAEHIRETIAQGRIRHSTSDSDDRTSAITVSVGIASYHSGNSLEEWLDCADKALYISKEKGRNRVTVYGAS